MTNTDPGQSPTTSSRRWDTPLWLALFLVMTAYSAVEAWTDNPKWWPNFAVMLTITMMLVTKLLGQRWRWNEAVTEQTHGLFVVLLAAICLSMADIATPVPWRWFGLILGVVIGIMGIARIIRGHRRMRGDGASRT